MSIVRLRFAFAFASNRMNEWDAQYNTVQYHDKNNYYYCIEYYVYCRVCR